MDFTQGFKSINGSPKHGHTFDGTAKGSNVSRLQSDRNNYYRDYLENQEGLADPNNYTQKIESIKNKLKNGFNITPKTQKRLKIISAADQNALLLQKSKLDPTSQTKLNNSIALASQTISKRNQNKRNVTHSPQSNPYYN
jgi:hypothetical protein